MVIGLFQNSIVKLLRTAAIVKCAGKRMRKVQKVSRTAQNWERSHGIQELVDGLDVGIADLPQRCRRWDPELSLPPQEFAYLPHSLQFGHVGLQEDPVDGSASQVT
jgi:hypothetical protein